MRRFALHLARTVAHTVNVDEMLNDIGLEQFEEWYQYYQKEPWGDDWLQAGTVASVIRNEFTYLMYALGTMTSGKQKKLKHEDMSEPGDFVPAANNQDAKKPKITSREEMLSFAHMITGV